MVVELGASSRVGAYILDRKLGGGSFGSVWLARHVEDGSLVAIKLLTGAQASGDRAAVRAEVELLAASASSRSPHVVRVLGGGVDPLPYIIMEYVEGRDLSQVIADRGALPPAEVVPLGLAIADALQALMDAGIIHRDVKPANVLIDNDGTAKLADFGIAKIVGMDTVTMTGQLPMTMAYAAPEVWEGTVSHQSDIYALGVVLYQCLVGQPPFSGNYGALYKAHASEPPDLDRLPDETPPSLRKLIQQCLGKDAASRPESSAKVIGLLRQAAAELTAPPSPEPTHFGPWRRRAPHATQAWSWRCVNDETGATATVEVHAFASVDEGERIKRAVAVNPALTPHGAEQLLGGDRLILRPGESFTDEPAGPFLFWVAREELAASPPTGEISVPRLRKIVEAISAMLAAASAANIALSFEETNSGLATDGSLHLRRPGLASPEEGALLSALAFVRGLPLDEDAAGLIQRSSNLNELQAALTASAVGPAHGVARVADGGPVGAATGAPALQQVAAGDGPERFDAGVPPTMAAESGGSDAPPVTRTGLGGLWDRARQYRLPLAGTATVISVAAVATAALLLRPPEPASAMVEVEGGTFVMGSELTEPGVSAPYSPSHPTSVEEFEIDRLEVTNAQYAAFLRESNSSRYPMVYDSRYLAYNWLDGRYPEGTENHPVVLVSAPEAEAYCEAQGKRLPTEAEWERAARGDDDRPWPWGDTFDGNKLNYQATTPNASIRTLPVGSFPEGESPYGALDMAGNVWEWTASAYAPYKGAEAPAESDGARVSRGGSWDNGVSGTRTFVRNWDEADFRSPTIGFRCARSAAADSVKTPPSAPRTQRAGTPTTYYAKTWTHCATQVALGAQGTPCSVDGTQTPTPIGSRTATTTRTVLGTPAVSSATIVVNPETQPPATSTPSPSPVSTTGPSPTTVPSTEPHASPTPPRSTATPTTGPTPRTYSSYPTDGHLVFNVDETIEWSLSIEYPQNPQGSSPDYTLAEWRIRFDRTLVDVIRLDSMNGASCTFEWMDGSSEQLKASCIPPSNTYLGSMFSMTVRCLQTFQLGEQRHPWGPPQPGSYVLDRGRVAGLGHFSTGAYNLQDCTES